jgi:hypothetical protein
VKFDEWSVGVGVVTARLKEQTRQASAKLDNHETTWEICRHRSAFTINFTTTTFTKTALSRVVTCFNRHRKTGNDEHRFAMTESTSREPDVPALQPPSHQASALSVPGTTRNNLPNHSRTTSGNRPTETQKPQPDTTSDQATAAFIRRTLCSHNVLLGNGEKGRSTPRPIDEALPPLTSSNEVDLQLYGIIAVIIKEFVQTWYSKITPDQVFVNEVIQIIAHCTRGLEQRLRKVDLETLLLDEIPGRLQAHLSCR